TCTRFRVVGSRHAACCHPLDPMPRAAILLVFAACSPQAPGPDLCEQAARHRESSGGDYVTPPVCTPEAEAAARSLLDMRGAQIREQQNLGKADGAFCDWFGAGCTPDESIFTGPSCTRDDQCGGGFCAEKHCFGGVGSDDFASIMDRFTESRETEGNATHLLVDNIETHDLRNQLMRSAQHSIHFTALLIENDGSGFETAALLEAAARRGVEVRVIVDATTQYDFAHYAVLEVMRDAGVQIVPFNPVFDWALLR